MESKVDSKIDSNVDSKPMKWYSLRVISGKEKATKENILFEAEDNSMSDMIDEIFVPYEKVIELKNNKKKLRKNYFSLVMCL